MGRLKGPAAKKARKTGEVYGIYGVHGKGAAGLTANLVKFWNLTHMNNDKVSAVRLSAGKISLGTSGFDDEKEAGTSQLWGV